MLDVEIAWIKKIGYGKIMSWILPRTHIKIYKRTKSGLQMQFFFQLHILLLGTCIVF